MLKKMDISGARLTPSWQGRRCGYSGLDEKNGCCCDECDYFLMCFPQYDQRIKGLRKRIIDRFAPEQD